MLAKISWLVQEHRAQRGSVKQTCWLTTSPKNKTVHIKTLKSIIILKELWTTRQPNFLKFNVAVLIGGLKNKLNTDFPNELSWMVFPDDLYTPQYNPLKLLNSYLTSSNKLELQDQLLRAKLRLDQTAKTVTSKYAWS